MKNQKNKLTIRKEIKRLSAVLSSIAMVITAIAELARVISLVISTKDEEQDKE